MVERWTFVGLMIQRLHIVQIYGLNTGKHANTASYKFRVFLDLWSRTKNDKKNDFLAKTHFFL